MVEKRLLAVFIVTCALGLAQWFLTGVHVPLGGTRSQSRGYEAPKSSGIHDLEI